MVESYSVTTQASRIRERDSSRYLAAGRRTDTALAARPEEYEVPCLEFTELVTAPRHRGVFFTSEDGLLHEVKVVSKIVQRKRRIEVADEAEFTSILIDIANDSTSVDSESKLHEIRCMYIVRYLADLMGIDPDSQLYRYLLIGALYHDEGKGYDRIKRRIRIKGKLTDDDRTVTHLHPFLGTLQAMMHGLDAAAEYPLSHHAFYDRTVGGMRGYPAFFDKRNPALIGIEYRSTSDETWSQSVAEHLGLSEAEQAQYLLFKEMLKAVDEIDAFCSLRVYRDHRLTREQLRVHLAENSGTRFNPEVVDLVLDNIDEIRFFHYLMYKTHGRMIRAMDLPVYQDFVEAPVELERTADGQVFAVAHPPTAVTWTEMSAQNVEDIILDTENLYTDFKANTQAKYRAHLNRRKTQ